MKKLLCILIFAFILLPSSSFADNKTIYLSIEEAQKIATENSKQAALDDIDIKNKQAIIDDSKYDLQFQTGDSLDNAYKANVKPIEIETNLEVAKRNKTNNLNTLKLNVYRISLDIILAEKQLATEKQKLEVLEQKLSIAKARFEHNMITQIDIDNAQYSVDSKILDIERLQDLIESLNLSFKKLLNLSFDDSLIKIKDDLVYNKLAIIDIEAEIKKAESVNTSIYEKGQIIRQKQNSLDDIIKYRGQGTTYFYDAQYDLEAAKIDLDDAKNNLEVSIRNKFNDLQNVEDNTILCLNYSDLADKRFKVSELKLANGALSKEGYLNDKLNYLDAIYQTYTAIHDLSIIKAEFDNLVGK